MMQVHTKSFGLPIFTVFIQVKRCWPATDGLLVSIPPLKEMSTQPRCHKIMFAPGI